MQITKLIRIYTPSLYTFLLNGRDNFFKFSKKSYSQFGEDLVLSTYINPSKKGFYVDVGAYHPFKFSNTYFYYKKGWNGINIDAKPGSMEAFKKNRRRDINLEMGISNNKEELDFYIYKEPAYNTFSKDLAGLRTSQGLKYFKKETIKTNSLENILDQYLPKDTKIDFISIDAEGLDLSVLKSNNWEKYQPDYILVELQGSKMEHVEDSEIFSFLKKYNYSLVSITNMTLIFKHQENNPK